MRKTTSAALTAISLAIIAAPSAHAQYRGNDRADDRGRPAVQEAYRDGYREGYQDARADRRYNDDYRRVEARRGNDRRGNDRRDVWQQQYRQTYNYQDDVYYRECRNTADPAGVIAGALIGGLLGNALGNRDSQAGTTIAGVVVGGALGATLTQNLNCEDRSYAYRTYHRGFTSGRPNTSYDWRNPQNNHRGEFRVGRYYDDPYGFRCATYSQSIFIEGRVQETQGEACQQPDGTWVIVS